MPPAQCPECGRFLSKDFVSALTDEGTPCPSCQHVLRPPDFGAASAAPEKTDAPAPPDPLAGWDQGRVVGLDADLAGAPGPSDVAVIGLGALIGALLGLLLGRNSRFVAMLFGAAVGAGAGAVSRRVWELPDDAAG